MKQLLLWTTTILSCAGGPVAAGRTPYSDIEVGRPHPDFLLPKLDGTLGRLSDYRGTKVLLIHFASW